LPGERSTWLDNAKGLLILLVVWGHLIEQAVLSNPVVAGVYGAIYLFHMPAFILVSGMLSSAALDRTVVAKIGRSLLLPLIVFQALYWQALGWYRPAINPDLLTPQWILWFLLSLATWRLLLPVFARLRFPILTATALAFAAGFAEPIGHTLSLSRTFVFFPAFLVGHLHGPRIRALVPGHGRTGAAVFTVLCGATAYVLMNGASLLPLYGSMPYAHIGPDIPTLAAARLGLIAAGIAAAIAFLTIVPTRAGLLTWLGRRSLPILLLHGFFVLLIWAATPPPVYNHTAAFLLGSAGVAGSVSLILACVNIPGIAMMHGLRRPRRA
jgi:fucose 4-O-acetylase-like acetyltransferase